VGVVTWAIADVTRGPSVLAVSLVDAEHKLVALVRRDRVQDGENGRTDRLEVRFSSSSSSPRAELYARAEAARLYAQACDTAGDLATGEGERGDDALEVRDPGMVGSTVELIGRDAGVVVGCFFEEPATSDLMGIFY
jgi:hypothetical protein